MKFFVISDVHGFYDIMRRDLKAAGFEENNPNHWLISCGDNFDRGTQSEEILQYLTSLPQKTLIKGNHEDLIIDCCRRGYPQYHDASNGTMQTIMDLGHGNLNSFELACEVAQNKLYPLYRQMVNYFETQNYVFVHSFIPYHSKEEWRDASFKEWKDARWGNPFKLYDEGYWKEDKTLVFGHWHTSKQWSKLFHTSEHGEDAIYDIFEGERFIGLDACTVLSKRINVLILEDDFLA